MEIQVGDPVMHWTYGYGQVVGIEDHVVSGHKDRYYVVSIGDLKVWVPSDDHVKTRLRLPSTQKDFKKLFTILKGKGEPLPDDRHDRKTWLMEILKDGQAASLCRVLRDLTSFQQVHSLNESDQSLMRRSSQSLIGEWIHAFSIPASEAEKELKQILFTGAIGEPVK